MVDKNAPRIRPINKMSEIALLTALGLTSVVVVAGGNREFNYLRNAQDIGSIVASIDERTQQVQAAPESPFRQSMDKLYAIMREEGEKSSNPLWNRNFKFDHYKEFVLSLKAIEVAYEQGDYATASVALQRIAIKQSIAGPFAEQEKIRTTALTAFGQVEVTRVNKEIARNETPCSDIGR